MEPYLLVWDMVFLANYELRQVSRMENIIVIIVSLATFLNSVMIILNFVDKVKKPVDKAVDKKFQKALEPITDKLDAIEQRIDKLDIHQCRSYLVDYLSDVEQGIPKNDIQTKRAYEIYDHYCELGGNSYIHDKWEKLMK